MFWKVWNSVCVSVEVFRFAQQCHRLYYSPVDFTFVDGLPREERERETEGERKEQASGDVQGLQGGVQAEKDTDWGV